VVRDFPELPREWERSLVERAQAGDQAAFTELYYTYSPRVYRFIYARTGNEADAEDVMQEVFEKVYWALPRYRWGKAPFAAWLFRIAYNGLIDWRRRNGLRADEISLPYGLIGDRPGPEEMAELRLTLDEVARAMAQLPEMQRAVLELRLLAELSVAEISRVLGKREGNVRALLHHGLQNLRKLLAERRRQGG